MRVILLIIFIMLPIYAHSRTSLTGNDLSFVGAFAMPRLVGDNEQTAYGNGLALRRVNGQVRLFSTAYKADNFSLYEVSVPTLKTSPGWNEAPLIKAWGYVMSDSVGLVNGIYWDDTDKRLYYSSSWNYITSGDPYQPSLGYITISPDETTTTSHGLWGFANRSVKQVNFGLTAVPSDFAAQYLNGKRLAAGFGGNQSAVGFGPGSYGPTLTAFAPPTTEAEGGYLSNTPLVGYGGSHAEWTSGSRPAISRAWRDDDQLLGIYGALSDPDNSTGNDTGAWNYTGDENFYWQGYSVTGASRAYLPDYITFPESAIKTKHWVAGNSFWTADYLGQSGAWIQTTNKEGFLLLPTFSTGHVYYESSEPKAEGFKHQWYIYSRDQLASVATGSVAESEIQAARYPVDFSHLGVTSSPFSGNPPWRCTGMAFDPADNRLYVMLSQASNAPLNNMYSTGLVAVYQINDTPALSGQRYPIKSISKQN